MHSLASDDRRQWPGRCQRAQPQLPDVAMPQNTGQTSNVVGVKVGDDQQRHPLDPQPIQAGHPGGQVLSGREGVDQDELAELGVAERMSYAPARIGRLTEHGQPLAKGAIANVVLYDPAFTRVVDPTETASLSRNNPYAGRELPGRVVATFLRGKATVLDGKLQ